MIPVIFNGSSAFLLTIEPRINGDGSLSATIPMDVNRGKTAMEERRPFGDSLRLSYSYEGILIAAELPAFITAIQGLTDQPILCPLWCARRRNGETHPVSANWWTIVGPSIVIPQLYSTATLPTYTAPENWIVPVMVGYFGSWPEPPGLTNTDATISIDFRESGKDFISFATYTAPLPGLTVGSLTPDVWPWRADISTAPTGDVAHQDVSRELIGEGREQASDYYAQPGYRMEKRKFTLQGSEPWDLLAYWKQNLGSSKPVWVQGWSRLAVIMADVSPSDAVVYCSDPNSRGASDSLILDNGVTRQPVKVTSNTSTGWNLAAPVGDLFSQDETGVYFLTLCRPVSPTIELRFFHSQLAQVDISFREIPWETLTSLIGETTGVTQGQLPVQVHLYTFSVDIPGATQLYRFTAFERDLTYTGNTYQAKPFSHGDITESLGLAVQSTSITSRAFVGNPLMQLIPFQLEAPLMLEICEADLVGNVVSNVRCMFYGEVSKAKFDGPYIEAQCKSLGNLLDRKIPKRLVQPGCNFTLFDVGCGVDRASWRYDAQFVSWAGSPTNVLRVNTVTKASVAQSGIVAHWFAAGEIIVGTGAAQQYRMIADSAAQSGGNIDLTLSTPIWVTPSAGTAVRIFPGCDGRIESGCNKFSNRARHGGFPFAPIGDPSFVKVSRSLSSGGKK